MQIKAHAKVNIFLKITGHRDGYHTLISRFAKVPNLYDTITLVPCECDGFTIEGCEGVETQSNTIYKAYAILLEETGSESLEEFFRHHKVAVEKRIPSQAGLGGGSSDAAAFMRLVNDVCDLGIDIDRLAVLSSRIGADMPFFVYDYDSANVSGFGEIVEKYDEEPLDIETYTPPIGCDTVKVYKTFKANFLDAIEAVEYYKWLELPSRDILALGLEPTIVNDLYKASLRAYPELSEYAREGWYFSGSGSSYFRIL